MGRYRGRVGDGVDRGDGRIAHVLDGGERLVQAGRDHGEVGRADDDLAHGDRKRRALHAPLAIADAAMHIGEEEVVGERDRGSGRLVDTYVTKAAIHLQITRMNLVAELNRLGRLVAGIQRLVVSGYQEESSRITHASQQK